VEPGKYEIQFGGSLGSQAREWFDGRTERNLMKAVILNGSPRKNGRIATILAAVGEALSESGQVQRFDAYNLQVKPCLGCMKCRPNSNCILPVDDAQRVRNAIESADVVVVGTPTYWGNMSAPLKAVFDRNVTLFETLESGRPAPRLKGKTAAIVATTGAWWPFGFMRTSGGGAVKSIDTVLRAGGIKVKAKVIVSGTRQNVSTIEELRSIGRKISNRLSQRRSNEQKRGQDDKSLQPVSS